jgi:hypothetical protein
MKEMPSSEFRKQYAALREPIAVTVNGHRIGAWIPGDTLDRFDAEREEVSKQAAGPVPANVHSFNSRGSRPVPKR